MTKSLIKTLLFIAMLASYACSYEFPEHFHQIQESEEKKREFLKTLLPIVVAENQAIMEDREFIQSYFSRDFLLSYEQKIGGKEHQRLAKIAQKYYIKNLYNKGEYLKKIDTIPISLALSQAALESGWGSSYYTKKYNNIFGHYTFYRSVPSRAIAGKRERIRVFETLQESVHSYMHNLNTHWAYREFRQARQEARAKNEPLSSTQAVSYLRKYSEIGERYAKLLQSLIRTNQLDGYDYIMAGEKESSPIGLFSSFIAPAF